MSAPIPDVSFKRNKTERLPCLLVVDGSSSMRVSGAIQELQQGLELLARTLQADDDSADGVQLAILRMGDRDDVQELTGFTDAADLRVPLVEANGSTPLGRAVDRAMQMIEDQKLLYRQAGIAYKRPWLWIMSDGAPTDEWQPVAARARAAQTEKRFTLWAIGIGAEAPLDALKAFTLGERCFRLGERDIKAMFEWMSASMAAGSKVAAGGQLALPAPPSRIIEM